MSRLMPAALIALSLFAGSRAAAQQSPRWFGQATFGPASRTTGNPTGGFHVEGRGGLLLTPHLGLVAGLSLARFSDETAVAGIYCPQLTSCPGSLFRVRGLSVAGLTVGLQPRLRAGPLEFALTGGAGGYWLYRRGSSLPALSTGVQGGLSLGLPVGERFRVLLEGNATHLFSHGAGEANTRRLGIGVGFN